MSKNIKSIKGMFGQTIHYKDGIKVGESWPGVFEGSQKHYDADGKYIGYSDCGIFAEQVHHDECGNYVGETLRGFFGQKKHYSAERRYVGNTWDGFIGDNTDLMEASDLSSSQGCDDFFDGGEW